MSDSLSETMTQWLGFVANVASFVGNLAIGPIQQRWFPFKLKRLIVLLFLLQLLGYAAFMFSLPLGTITDQKLLPLGAPALVSVLCFASAMLGASTPLFYELGAELTYPANEGISAGVVSMLNNAGGLILLFVMPAIAKSWNSALMFGSVVLCSVLMVFVKEKYLRGQKDLADQETR